MSQPLTKVTADSFLMLDHSSFSSIDQTIIFFIPGNPGLISYYHLFLSLLVSNLSSQHPGSDGLSSGSKVGAKVRNRQPRASKHVRPQFHVHGKSLGGFEIQSEGGKLYGLREQIEFVEKGLEDFVNSWQDAASENSVDGPEPNNECLPRAQVILVAHSVGSYIAMEILRRHQEKRKMPPHDVNDAGHRVDIVAGVLLFPTVVDIAKSPSGRILTLLLHIPHLALLTSLLVKFLVFLLPASILRSLVSLVMRSPPDSAVDTTLGFLKSRSGVRQAVHMSADEMREISADKWSDEIWGTVTSSATASNNATSRPPMKLVFYFGRNDHWVAEQTRDDIIQARGPKPRSEARDEAIGPKMVVCEDGVLHGFCLRHSEVMAKKVAAFIRDIIKERGKGEQAPQKMNGILDNP